MTFIVAGQVMFTEQAHRVSLQAKSSSISRFICTDLYLYRAYSHLHN